MSDRLAISSAISVLAMAAFVLFGANVERAPLAGERANAPVTVSAGIDLPAPRDLLKQVF